LYGDKNFILIAGQNLAGIRGKRQRQGLHFLRGIADKIIPSKEAEMVKYFSNF